MPRLRRPLPTLVAVSLAVAALAACSDSGSSTPTTGAPTTPAPTTGAPSTTGAPATSGAPAEGHIRGTAYTFNTPDPIAGATISLVEFPEITAVTADDGSYELAVPAGATVTPVIEAEGHHSIHLQTFTLDADHEGVEIDGANFQTPTDDIYAALSALISGFVGKDPFADGACVIVTTVSDKRVVGMTFDEFINFHPHGKPGATAAIEPANAQPIYFNSDVLPDLAQTVVSDDGGVLWANVPPGVYTLSAQLEGTSFATAQVTCESGWVVNANPVWGLHELP